jgi:hypothetical protein
VVIDVIRCWLHGFGYKTGAEPWLAKMYKRERMNRLVKELKKEELGRRAREAPECGPRFEDGSPDQR